MRYALISVLFLSLSAHAAATRPATQPAEARQPSVTLAEPSADHKGGPGRLSTLRGLEHVGPLKKVVITEDLNAPHAAENGMRIDESNLEALLRGAEPLAPDDPLLDEWAYAPWCSARFEMRGRKWSATFYLGGLGILMDDDGRRGAFRFKPPQAPPRDAE